MKKTTKILLGLLITTGILHISSMYIPQFFEIERANPSLDSEDMANDPTPYDTTKTAKPINTTFKHIVFFNDSANNNNGYISIYRNKISKNEHPSITYSKEASNYISYKATNDTLYISMAELPENLFQNSYYGNHIKIEVIGDIESISNSSLYNIDIYNLEGDSLNILAPSYIKTSNNETKPNPFPSTYEIGLYRCNINQLNNYSDAGIDIIESNIKNLHQTRTTWSSNKGNFLHNNNRKHEITQAVDSINE